jgi:hypothetical protein
MKQTGIFIGATPANRAAVDDVMEFVADFFNGAVLVADGGKDLSHGGESELEFLV